MKRLLVGTERGLLVLAEAAGDWRIERTLLPDYEISCVVRRAADHRVYVATRQAGLFLANPRGGTVEAVGAGVLPVGIRCVSAAPSDPEVMYVGCEPSAIFRSGDGGRTWRECTAVGELARLRGWQYHIDRIPAHIRHILVDRRDPNRLYAAVQIGGVILSGDGGQTWADVTDCIDPDVHSIVQDAGNPDVLYASTGGGGPIGGPHPPLPPSGFGLYRSADAGRSWAAISSALGEHQHGVPVHLYPRDPATIVAALAHGTPPQWRSRAEGADALLVISTDRGQTWSQGGEGLPPSFPVMIDAIDTEPGPNGRTYIGIGGEGTKVLPPQACRGLVYYADDLGGPWRKLPMELPTVYTVTTG